MKKVLFLGDYVARTGFGTVSKNIISELRKHFGSDLQLDIIAINYFGEPYYEDVNTCVVSGKRNDVKDDDFGRHFLLKMLSEGDYDGLFICQDLGIITPIIEIIQHVKSEKRKNNRKSFKSIFYFPVDCHLVEVLTKDIELFDLLVTYTEFGRNEVLKFKPELKGKIKVIPHGNNPKDFYPLPMDEKLKFRKEYFGVNADKFIITNINRNQPRKDISCTIMSFYEYWLKNKNAFLYLNMNPQDPMGNDIRGIMLQLPELQEDINYKLLPKEMEQEGVSVDVLNKIYNACDAFLTTTTGGGWELTVTEAMACRLPVIAPNHTSLTEIGANGRLLYLEDFEPRAHIIDNVIRPHCYISEVVEKLELLNSELEINNPNLIERLNKSEAFIKTLSWDIICKRWIQYFKEIF